MLTFLMLIIQILLILLGIYIISEEKLGVKLFVTIMLITPVVSWFLSSVIGVFKIFFLLALFVSFLFFKTRKIRTSMVIPCIAVISLVLSNFLAQIITSYFFADPLDIVKTHQHFFVVVIIYFVFSIMLNFLVRYVFRRGQVYQLIEGRYGKLLIIFLMLTLTIFSVNIYIGEQQGFCRENIRINGMLFILYACLLFGVFIILTYIVMKDSQMEQERIQAQNLKEYMLELEQLYDSISSFRHDYINILLSLEEGIRSEDVVAIKDVYEKLVKPTEEFARNDQCIFGKLRNLHINEVKSILAAKIMQAKSQKIDVKLEIEEVIENIYMDLLDFCRVFSILVDNAMEAAMETKKPYISIAFIQDDKVQCIMIENNSREQKINLQEVFEKGYSSKGSNRGIGLYSVRQLLGKNKYATLETSYESGIFMQALTLKESVELPSTT